jgi:hypothetical protein
MTIKDLIKLYESKKNNTEKMLTNIFLNYLQKQKKPTKQIFWQVKLLKKFEKKVENLTTNNLGVLSKVRI